MVSSVAFCREVRAEKPSLDFVTRRLSSLAEAVSEGWIQIAGGLLSRIRYMCDYCVDLIAGAK